MRETRRRKRSKGEPHVRLHIWLLKQASWLSLSAPARVVLIQLMSRYNGSNNGRIGYSVRTAAKECRLSKTTASRAFKELTRNGFIECKIRGGFSRKVRHATEWLLTEFRDDVSGELAKKTFMRWRKSEALSVKGQT
jgi:DNA-binding MarR family transcriptional regulator